MKKAVISVIIPVFNESNGINTTLSHLGVILPEGFYEVIVVDGDPAGSTLNAVTGRNIKKYTAPRGRACQMNEGARHANGEILLFLHADTLLPYTAYIEILKAMSRNGSGAGAFRLGFPSRRWPYRLIAFFANLRTRISGIPFGDQGIFLRCDIFKAIGGYSNIPLMEDIDLMRKMKKTGAAVTIVPLHVQTSTRRWENEGLLYTTLRNYLLQFFYFMGVAPSRLVKYYYRDMSSQTPTASKVRTTSGISTADEFRNRAPGQT